MVLGSEAGAIEAARRQLRRVRWRRNFHELQRALYLLIALAAGAVAATVLAALRLEGRLFAAAAGALMTGALAAAIAIVVRCRRRWLDRGTAACWADDRAMLEGRLATLDEVATRRPPPLLLPLLVEQNRERLASWRPEVLVPESFPPLALGAVVVAASVLGLVVLVAPHIPPPAPAIVRTVGGVALTPDAIALRAEPGAAADEDAAWTITRLPDAVEARIRRAAWGEGWDRTAETAASGERTSVAGDSPSAEDVENGWRIARAAASGGDREGAGAAAAPTGPDGDGRGPEPGAPDRTDGAESGPAETGEPATGAGSGTDPHLFGPASERERRAAAFELPLAARVRALENGPRPPEGDAPAAAPDAHPDVAAGRRRDAPVLRMAVPPVYEDVVRRMFAHAEAEAP